MKKLLLIPFLLIPQLIIAQVFYPDSLKLALKTATSDSVLFKINFELEDYYEEVNVDSALSYADKSLKIARKTSRLRFYLVDDPVCCESEGPMFFLAFIAESSFSMSSST